MIFGNDPASMLHAVAIGAIPNTEYLPKFGLNDDVDASSAPEDVWTGGGLYTGFPTGSAERLSIVSTSGNDAAAGTGMRTVRIIGLNATYDVVSEDITMNGVTPVLTSGTFMRVRSVYGLTGGSTQTNAGTVTVAHETTTANVFSVILPGFGQANQAVATVPNGYRGLLLATATCTSKSPVTNVDMCMGVVTRDFGTSIWRTQYLAAGKTATGTNYSILQGGLPLQAKTDVVMRCISASADNIRASALLELILYRV